MSANQAQEVRILYTNWRGKTALRRIIPQGEQIGQCDPPEDIVRFRTCEPYHPHPQWLLTAFDVEKQATRTFALSGIKAWGDEAVSAAIAQIPNTLPQNVEAELAAYEARGIKRSQGLNMLGWIYCVDTWDERWTDERKSFEIVKTMVERLQT